MAEIAPTGWQAPADRVAAVERLREEWHGHNQAWLAWCESLNARGAEPLIVRAIALSHDGIVRFTGDLDIFVHATEENARRVRDALG